jgi:N-acetylglucosaminyldiphosphoundecaprenol N-acetyl-beta-D-mannosaminyltransferase
MPTDDAVAGVPFPIVQISDILFHAATFNQTVSWIAERARAGGGTVCTPNADYVVRARRDAVFRSAINSADLRVPDGMAVVYAARLAGLKLRRTVTGRLLLPAVAKRASAEGWPISLFGAGDGIAGEAAAELRRRYPGLQTADAFSPPMRFEIGSETDHEAVARLRASGARVIFVALGAPKQEIWMAAHRADLPDAVLVGVGAAFDIVAGRFREAPAWTTHVGLEWLIRLAQEPRRLARRYLIDDPWIFGWALRARLSNAPDEVRDGVS